MQQNILYSDRSCTLEDNRMVGGGDDAKEEREKNILQKTMAVRFIYNI